MIQPLVRPEIPLWFYEVSSGIYLLSAIICFFVGYFAFKAYKMYSKKNLLYFFLGFTILGIGFLILTLPSIYVYLALEFYEQPPISINEINYIGFSLYYITSLIAYILLASMYLSEKIKNKFFVLFVPLWYADSLEFHLLSLVLILLVFIQTIFNSLKKKKLNSYLVSFTFLCLSIFHLLLILIPFNVTMYLIANLILITGFASLLYMLIRVNAK